jgi:hypothetical protein
VWFSSVPAQQFFAGRGLKAERIPETTRKTPDFRIFCGDVVVAYCEVKSPQNVFPERIADAIRQGKGGIIDIGNDDRQGRCIARAARKAEPQFAAINPAHSVPNILLIVNHDTTARMADFVEAVTGYIEELGKYAATSLRKEIQEIDAYVWLNLAVSEKRIFWKQNEFRDKIIGLLKCD